MAHLTRPAEISGVSAGLFPETAAGNRAYSTVNLVPRVLGLLDQRVSARRDSGIIDLNYIFDWPIA